MQLQPFPADNPTTPQPSLSCPPFIHPYNHDSTTLRVESNNDSDTTILNPRFPKPDNNQTTSQPQPAKRNRRSGVCSFMHHLYDSFKSYFVVSFRKTERNQSINITQKPISDPALTVPLIHLFKFSHLKLA